MINRLRSLLGFLQIPTCNTQFVFCYDCGSGICVNYGGGGAVSYVGDPGQTAIDCGFTTNACVYCFN